MLHCVTQSPFASCRSCQNGKKMTFSETHWFREVWVLGSFCGQTNLQHQHLFTVYLRTWLIFNSLLCEAFRQLTKLLLVMLMWLTCYLLWCMHDFSSSILFIHDLLNSWNLSAINWRRWWLVWNRYMPPVDISSSVHWLSTYCKCYAIL